MTATPASEPGFELMDARRGWGHSTAPFNLAIGIQVGGRRRRVSTSLELLVELYGHVRHEQPCHIVGGSGTVVELEEWGTDVRLRINYAWTTQTSFARLERELESVLAETFAMQDRLATAERRSSERRADSLAALQEHVADREVAFDVPGLYDRLTE